MIAKHDRAKDDDLAKAVAAAGGFFGVTIVPGFMQENEHLGTLDDFATQVDHLVNVMGIDHVGIGSDICGNGPETGSMIEYPESMPGTIGEQRRNPDVFDWSGFREEHRISDEYRIKDGTTDTKIGFCYVIPFGFLVFTTIWNSKFCWKSNIFN